MFDASTPILFLDIDGVLNGDSMFREKTWLELSNEEQLSDRMIGVLNDIINETGARIVISSTWRVRYYDFLVEYLPTRGLEHGIFLGKTPNHETMKVPSAWGESTTMAICHNGDLKSMGRGMEIEEWILTNVERSEIPKLRVLILDDQTDMGRMRPYLLQTTSYGPHQGLCYKHIKIATRVLKNPLGDHLVSPNPMWTEAKKNELYPPEEA